LLTSSEFNVTQALGGHWYSGKLCTTVSACWWV